MCGLLGGVQILGGCSGIYQKYGKSVGSMRLSVVLVEGDEQAQKSYRNN